MARAMFRLGEFNSASDGGKEPLILTPHEIKSRPGGSQNKATAPRGSPQSAQNQKNKAFGEGPCSNFHFPKVPPTGGPICRTHIQARLRCAKPCRSRRCRRGANLISPEIAEPVGRKL